MQKKNKKLRGGSVPVEQRLATYDGSEPLWNAPHEQIVQEYLCNGYSRKKAYQITYKKSDKQMAHIKRQTWYAIFAREEVKRRISWIFKDRREKFEKNGGKRELIEILKRRVLATPRDYMTWGVDDDGAPIAELIPSEYVDAMGLDSVEITPTQYGDKLKVRVAKKEDVIELIAKLEGMIVDKHQLNASFEVTQNKAANEAYRRRLEKMAAKKVRKKKL